jgi:hypothetical protein
MFLDAKKKNKRGKKGIFALTSNLVMIIAILFLIGVVTYVLYTAVSGKLTVHP